MTTLKTNDEFLKPGASEPLFVVTQTGLPRQRVRVLDLSTNQERVFEVSDLGAQIGAGELLLRRPGAPKVSPAMQRDTALDEATNRALQEVRAVRAYSERNGASFNQAYLAVQKIRSAKKSTNDSCVRLPSKATMYRHRKSVSQGLPVFCGNANKGNRSSRYSADVVQLILDNAKALHQKPGSRWSILALTKLCNQQIPAEKLPQSGQGISTKYVKRLILDNLDTDADIARLEPHLRAAKKGVAKYSIRVHGFLQRVEQDALHLPWRVQTPEGVITDLYLVHAIDVATSLPVGFSFSFGMPNATVSLECVESILYSKKELLAALNVKFDADPHGAPGCMVFDNGPEAKNERIGGLPSLGIELSYCKSHHPHHKPYIERLNRALKEALETLPGCTRMDGKDGCRDPEALGDLPMSFEELKRWIVRFYYEDWALRPLERLIRSDIADACELGATPLIRYQRMQQAGYSMPLPPNRDDWLRVKFQVQTRTLSRTTGITVDNFHFKGRNLESLISHFGETEVSVLTDPDDFRMVRVVRGTELVPLVNAAVSEATPALSFELAKEKEKAAAAEARALGTAITDQFYRDLYARSAEKNERRTGKRGAADASKQARQKMRHKQSVDKARSNPLPVQSAAAGSSLSADFSLAGLSSLAVVDRRTGKAMA